MIMLLVFACVVLNTAAQLLLKIGMGRIGHFDLTMDNLWPIGLKVATSLPIIGGLFLYVFSVVVWLVVLSRAEVSVVYPLNSLAYVVMALAAWWFLGEQVGMMRIGGIVIIMAGVYMISRTA